MIRKILYADGFGQLRASKWDNSCNEFKKYNMFYGWNYSGKTTISRMFRCFELSKLHEDYPGGVCKLQREDNSVIDTSSFASCPPIKVFNTDFIESNIKWEARIEPILMIGEENIELQSQLATSRDQLAGVKSEIVDIQGQITALSDTLAGKLTEKARDIKNNFSKPNYNKNNLLPVVQSLKTEIAKLTESELSIQQQTYFSSDKRPSISEIAFKSIDLQANVDNVSRLLNTTVVSKTIDRLKEKPELSNWVKKGKQLHEGKTTCEFCGSRLPDGLLENLSQHFSTEFEEHLQDIDTHIKTLSTLIPSITFHDESRFYSEFAQAYSEQRDQVNFAINELKQSVEKLCELLLQKKNRPFDKIPMPHMHIPTKYDAPLGEINAIIKRHNDKSDKFESEKTLAFTRLEKHFASEFIEDTRYFDVLIDIDKLKQRISAKKVDSNNISNLCTKLEEQLSESVKGAERINHYLKAYFSKDDISVRVTADNSFQLFRGDTKAKNLSGGEKTAISFAYFMTKLEDKSSNLSDSIVLLDDPISSLDINHLFNTYSFIKNHLSKCKQLFIFTHTNTFID